MKKIEYFTIDALKGFEGNHADDILDEINALNNDTLTILYNITSDALLACMNDNADLPSAIMEHFSAIRTAFMQEVAKRAISDNLGAH